MKRQILLITLGLMTFLTPFTSKGATNVFDLAIPVKEKFVREKEAEKPQDTVIVKQLAKFQVQYIVGENDKYYVIFINSDHPELHHKIIQMVNKLTVDPSKRDKLNNLVIEFEL